MSQGFLGLHHFTLGAIQCSATDAWTAPEHMHHWPRQESIHWNSRANYKRHSTLLADTCASPHVAAALCGWAPPAAVKGQQNSASIERNLSKLDCWTTWRHRQAWGEEKTSLSGCGVKGEKKTQLHLPGHLKTSSASAPAHYMAAREHVVVCQAAGRGCSSQATAELPWASGGNRARRVCVYECARGMKYYVSCSSTLWLPHPICSARLSVPNKNKPGGTLTSDSISHMSVCWNWNSS